MEVDLSMQQIENSPSPYKEIAKEMFYRYGIILIFVGMIIFFTLMNPRFLSLRFNW